MSRSENAAWLCERAEWERGLSAPRTWGLPPEPGPEVTAIACDCHGVWSRGLGRAWYLIRLVSADVGPYRVYWPELYGDHVGWRKTLTEVRP